MKLRIIGVIYFISIPILFASIYFWAVSLKPPVQVPTIIELLTLPGNIPAMVWPGIHSGRFLEASAVFNVALFWAAGLLVARWLRKGAQ